MARNTASVERVNSYMARDIEMAGLTGQHVLIVEDEVIISLDLMMILRSEGAEIIGPAPDVAVALSYIRSTTIDCALLDLQLGNGEDVSPVADLLAQAGVPFIFVTAHNGHDILSQHPLQPIVKKPYAGRDIVIAVHTALAAGIGR